MKHRQQVLWFSWGAPTRRSPPRIGAIEIVITKTTRALQCTYINGTSHFNQNFTYGNILLDPSFGEDTVQLWSELFLCQQRKYHRICKNCFRILPDDLTIESKQHYCWLTVQRHQAFRQGALVQKVTQSTPVINKQWTRQYPCFPKSLTLLAIQIHTKSPGSHACWVHSMPRNVLSDTT